MMQHAILSGVSQQGQFRPVPPDNIVTNMADRSAQATNPALGLGTFHYLLRVAESAGSIIVRTAQ